MNTNNICVGLVVKNYKEMCSLLDEEVKGGKSKILQVEEWKKYFAFNRDGNKYIITEVYNDVDIIDSDIKSKSIVKNIENGKYSKDIYPIVKSFVGKYDIEYIPKGKLLLELGLVNKNYNLAYLYPKEFSKFICNKYNKDIDEESLNTIVNSIYTISHNKIHNAFSNLEKLKYIYSYDNKMLMVYYKDSYAIDFPCIEETKHLNKCIYEGKLKALSNFYVRSKKSMEDYISLITKFKNECDNSIDDMNKKLNSELFLKGLSKEAHDIALKEINNIYQFKNIKNFFYVYGYIRNDDIEWEKEIIDIAKENIYLNNYKEKVKSMFVLDTFLDKWFDTKHDAEDKYVNKYEFKSQLEKHRQDTKEIINILFDLLTSQDNKKIIKYDDMKQYNQMNKNISNNSTTTYYEEELNELPF